MKNKKLNSIQSAGFKIPEDYLETFDALLLNKLKNSNPIQETKNSGFKVPEHYFETFDDRLAIAMDSEKELYAAIDLGSNSSHMVVAEIIDDQLHVIDRHKDMVRLADGLDQNGQLTEEKIKKYFNQIHVSGERLMVLLNDLLDLSKLEAGKIELNIEKVKLIDVIKSCVAEQEILLNTHKLKIEYQFPDDFPAIECDKNRIGQVIMNLLGNAIKFSPDGSEIRFTANIITQEGNKPASKMYRLSISDQGSGVADEEKKLIFNKFIQSRLNTQVTGGTGLGLAITRELIKVHQGSIWCEDSPGGGAIFVFQAPLQLTV